LIATSLFLWAEVAGAEGECGTASCSLIPAGGKAGSLEGWKSYLLEDARTEDVWTLGQDGVLHCKGAPLGYLYTEQDYGCFVLELDYRWPPGQEPGKGGVLIRTTGPHKIWPKSLEAQINVGDAGDFWGLDGFKLDGPEDRRKKLEHPQFGKLINLKKTASVEKPAGQWNHYKIVAQGETVTLEINGQVVNQATACESTPGKIVLTSEGTPIEFRNVVLKAISVPKPQ
jgi:hypothetical protein